MIKIYFKANIFILGFLFLTLTKGQDPDFSATINSAGGTGGINYDLTFGFSPSATDGYDEGIDFYAPPSPPPPLFDAALSLGGDRYYTQIVNGSVDDLVEHEWEVQLQYDIDNLFIKEAYSGKSITMKRFRPRAKGRASGIKKPFANLTIILSENINQKKEIHGTKS